MFPNGTLFCFSRGANGFIADVICCDVDVFVTVVLVEPNGEAFRLPNVGVENGERFETVVLGEAEKILPVFANGELEDVAVLPNVLLVVVIGNPNPLLANGVELVLVDSNCEVAVANGLFVAGVPPNGVVLPTDITLFCVLKTFGVDVDTAAPKIFVGCWVKLKADVVVVAEPPKTLLVDMVEAGNV